MKKFLLYAILIIIVLFWYMFYISSPYWENIKNIEKSYPVIAWINTNFRNLYSEIISKINPHYKQVENDVKWTIENTNKAIEEVKTTLSWAQETIDKAWKVIEKWKETIDSAKDVMWDVDKMWEWIMDSVNPNIVQ